jgi:hypothetical protein
MKPRPPEPAPSYGSVRADEVIPAPELRRRLHWGQRSLPEAERRGLRTATFGRWKYIIGADFLAWVRKLAEEQAAGDGDS